MAIPTAVAEFSKAIVNVLNGDPGGRYRPGKGGAYRRGYERLNHLNLGRDVPRGVRVSIVPPRTLRQPGAVSDPLTHNPPIYGKLAAPLFFPGEKEWRFYEKKKSEKS